VSLAAGLAAELDPDGVLDRRFLKKLADQVGHIEHRKKEAENKATTLKGKIALQKAMQRRASLARLMTGIATNAAGAAAGTSGGGGGGDAAAAAANAGGDGSTYSPGSILSSPGLAIYTTRPKLR
jgi:hypothetical protein